MKKFSTILPAILLVAGCSQYSTVDQLKLSNGQILDVVRHRSDVRFADCGTLNVIQTWLDGKLIDSKEGRGGALHCDLMLEALKAGGWIGGAEIVAQGAQKAAKAAASASNSLSITNSNTNNAEGYYSGQQTLTQSQTQSQTGGVTGGSSHHPNNGFGNGGGDGSPNGKQDHDR